MQGIKFYPVSKPWIDLQRCQKWIKMCGRTHEQLNVSKFRGRDYVCSKVFLTVPMNQRTAVV